MHNDNDDTIFVLDDTAGAARLVFTTEATHKLAGPGRIPLWWYQPRSEDELAALAVWLAEHRELWPAWRAMSEAGGHAAVSDEMSRLWSLGPIESCGSVMCSRGDDPRDIVILAMLVTRSSEIVRHRFKSAAHLKAFMEWYLSDISANCTFLLFQGCLVGTASIKRIMDRLAQAGIDGRRKKRSRVPTRKAA